MTQSNGPYAVKYSEWCVKEEKLLADINNNNKHKM